MYTIDKQKLVNLILLAVFLFMFIITPYIMFVYIKESVRQDILNAMQTVNETTEQSVNVWLQEEKSIIKSWGEQGSTTLTTHTKHLLKITPTKEMLAKSEITKQLREHLAPLIKNKGYKDFFVVSPDFINIGAMQDADLGQKNILLNQENILQRALDGESILTPPQILHSVSNTDSQHTESIPAMFVLSPVRSQQGKAIAIIVFRIDPRETFTNLLQRGRIGKTGETYAINKSAKLISASRYETKLREYGIIEKNKSGILSVPVRDPGYNLLEQKANIKVKSLEQAPLTLMAQSVISGINSYNLEGYRDYRGVPVIGVWRWNSELGVGIATEINVDDAFDTLGTIWLVIIISACINILLIITVLIKFIQHHRAVKLQSLEDGLTGLANRRMLDIKLELEFNAALRHVQPLTICMIDIDHFKLFNDKMGHLAGDNALKSVAQCIKGMVKRKSDLAARFGGEEFCVILPNTPLHKGVLMAEKIRKAIVDLQIPHHATCESPFLTVSIGVTAFAKEQDTRVEDVITRADKELYHAKESGRNCVRPNA